MRLSAGEPRSMEVCPQCPSDTNDAHKTYPRVHKSIAATDHDNAARPRSRARRYAVGSQSTRPASSTYPTNATMSISACATSSGITRPQRR